MRDISRFNCVDGLHATTTLSPNNIFIIVPTSNSNGMSTATILFAVSLAVRNRFHVTTLLSIIFDISGWVSRFSVRRLDGSRKMTSPNCRRSIRRLVSSPPSDRTASGVGSSADRISVPNSRTTLA